MESLLSVIRSLKGSRVRGEHLQRASAPATSLSPSLSLYSILFSSLSLSPPCRFRERDASSGSFCFQCSWYRSARTVYNADAAVFETVYTPASQYSVYRVLFPNPCTASGTRGGSSCGWGGNGGWRKSAFHAHPRLVRYFFFVVRGKIDSLLRLDSF